MEGYELHYRDWKPGEYPREVVEAFNTLGEARARARALRLGFYEIKHYRSGYGSRQVELYHAA